MTGTEKQITWAENLIDSIRNSAQETINIINEKTSTRVEKLINNGKPSRAQQVKELAEEQIEEINELFEYIPKITKASNVINLRLTADKAAAGTKANWRRIAAEVALMAGIRL